MEPSTTFSPDESRCLELLEIVNNILSTFNLGAIGNQFGVANQWSLFSDIDPFSSQTFLRIAAAVPEAKPDDVDQATELIWQIRDDREDLSKYITTVRLESQGLISYGKFVDKKVEVALRDLLQDKDFQKIVADTKKNLIGDCTFTISWLHLYDKDSTGNTTDEIVIEPVISHEATHAKTLQPVIDYIFSKVPKDSVEYHAFEDFDYQDVFFCC
eukprot:TRINITY_DN5035_c0_g1_i1.p1 TRINITY_DN5035_c0_g1~~TRINITY_DN5035_c0_g1_i1.p1  ORF type:complete len:214 (-),score=65.43 TRINITY_DN5035_c0_g1_i1:309-950(-)